MIYRNQLIRARTHLRRLRREAATERLLRQIDGSERRPSLRARWQKLRRWFEARLPCLSWREVCYEKA